MSIQSQVTSLLGCSSLEVKSRVMEATTYVWIPTFPFVQPWSIAQLNDFGTLGKLLNLHVSQFSFLQNKKNNRFSDLAFNWVMRVTNACKTEHAWHIICTQRILALIM